jgi:hypothetical protein
VIGIDPDILDFDDSQFAMFFAKICAKIRR